MTTGVALQDIVRLRDVSALVGMSKLVWLSVPGNPIGDVYPFGRLTAMRWLWLDAGTSRANAVLLPRPDTHPSLLIVEAAGGGAGASERPNGR